MSTSCPASGGNFLQSAYDFTRSAFTGYPYRTYSPSREISVIFRQPRRDSAPLSPLDQKVRIWVEDGFFLMHVRSLIFTLASAFTAQACGFKKMQVTVYHHDPIGEGGLRINMQGKTFGLGWRRAEMEVQGERKSWFQDWPGGLSNDWRGNAVRAAGPIAHAAFSYSLICLSDRFMLKYGRAAFIPGSFLLANGLTGILLETIGMSGAAFGWHNDFSDISDPTHYKVACAALCYFMGKGLWKSARKCMK